MRTEQEIRNTLEYWVSAKKDLEKSIKTSKHQGTVDYQHRLVRMADSKIEILKWILNDK